MSDRLEGHCAMRSMGAGGIAILPVTVGIVPFGMIVGVAVSDADLTLTLAVGFSVLIFAGASQLAAVDLLTQGAPLFVILATVLVINSRLLMYSASIAPHLSGVGRTRRMLGAYFLTDQSYAVSIAGFSAEGERGVSARNWWYYLGVGVTAWFVWQVSTVAGFLLGGSLSSHFPMGFAMPLAFLALLIPALHDRPAILAAVCSGIVAVTAAELPAQASTPLAAVSGMLVGWWASVRQARTRV